jgi:hypothetical protein
VRGTTDRALLRLGLRFVFGAEVVKETGECGFELIALLPPGEVGNEISSHFEREILAGVRVDTLPVT